MAVGAAQDMQTSRMIWVNLDNRRVSAFDRDHLSIGISHLHNDKLEKAFKCFSKGIMVCKQVHIAMIFRGIVQYRRGKFFEALDDFTNASKNIESSNILIKNHMEDILIARFNRGVTHIRLGDDGPGVADLKFALAINPNNVHIRSMLMQVQRRASNYIEAVEHCLFIKNVAEEEAAVKNDSKSLDGDSTDDFKNKQLSLPSAKSVSSKSQPPKVIKRGVSHFESMVDFAMSSEVYKPKTVDIDVKVPECSFPGLKEKKAHFLQQKNQEFFRILSICHDVIPEKIDGKIKLSASNPDDEALVCAAEYFGFSFCDRIDKICYIQNRETGNTEQVEVLAAIGFTSKRKRMSVIIRDCDGKIKLYCKGADTMMLPRLRAGQDALINKTNKDMRDFAVEGLRCLIIASAVLPQQDFEQWHAAYTVAASDLGQIELKKKGEPNKIEDLEDRIENNLVINGSTAIEDRLQDG